MFWKILLVFNLVTNCVLLLANMKMASLWKTHTELLNFLTGREAMRGGNLRRGFGR